MQEELVRQRRWRLRKQACEVPRVRGEFSIPPQEQEGDLVFERYTRSGPSRLEMMDVLAGQGMRVPRYGRVRDLASELPGEIEVVVHLDELAHQAEGKIKCPAGDSWSRIRITSEWSISRLATTAVIRFVVSASDTGFLAGVFQSRGLAFQCRGALDFRAG